MNVNELTKLNAVPGGDQISITNDNIFDLDSILNSNETIRAKEKLENITNPQSAFLGPNLWNNTCEEITLYSVFDELFNYNESQDSSEQQTTSTSCKDQAAVTEVPEIEEQPSTKRKRGRKPGSKVSAMKVKKKEVIVPGVDFDPKNCLCQEDLQVQPIIRKSEKKTVPGENKDTSYWKRRIKNNVAAKKSREARRAKDNHIVLRAAYLEKECNNLRKELEELQKQNLELKRQLRIK